MKLSDDLPLPDDAPEPGSSWRTERPEPGLLHLILDPPHRPKIALFDAAVMRDLALALDAIEKDGEVRALVVTGREPLSFAAGADVDAIASLTEGEEAARFVRFGQHTFGRLERLSIGGGGRIRVVAAVGGPVPVGACEITLCCDRIVLADHRKTRIGLPEVRLGIFPAWGGSTRLPRRIGVPQAMAAILTGRLYRPRKAKRLGLVDRLTQPEYLVRVASDIAMGRLACPRKGRGARGWLIDRNPLAGALIAHQSLKQVLRETRGNYPAPLAVIPLVVRAPRIALERGLAAEVEAVKQLAVSPVTKSLVGLFKLSEEAKKLGRLPDGGSEAPRVRRAAVIGAGVMGGAVASLMAEKRVDVRLRDIDRAQLDRAEVAHRKEIEKQLKRRRTMRHEADAAIDRFETTTGPEGFGRCELVVEAVAERLEVKHAVFRELAEAVADDTILATNTSSLSVDAIAAEVPHPERVVGMHFFNPVRRMPLVEIVRGRETSPEVVARTAQLAIDLGKTPVVCKDVAGFLVNRLLGPYLDEAVRLAEAGADVEAVDRAMLDFGMPMGPFELLDEVGLDIAAHAAQSLEEAYGERMIASTLLEPLVEAGQLGKKTGTGIFVWGPGQGGRKKKTGRNLKTPPARGGFEAEAIVDRLVLAMVNEGARALEEEVVAGARELDLATVFGLGFAPVRGGLLRYADARGLPAIVERLRVLSDASGIADRASGQARFTPAPLLVELARDG
ncbi:MAG: 3-hydroxyacyl-CoA dehydrogenase NAD-binding domain-containing protein, partial [Planctomycetota bacterium]|nr:3-hydroxyacyl-CoA dehydrogenase NAD-binding domain-containing protein [Planctomycetota bacterium]